MTQLNCTPGVLKRYRTYSYFCWLPYDIYCCTSTSLLAIVHYVLQTFKTLFCCNTVSDTTNLKASRCETVQNVKGFTLFSPYFETNCGIFFILLQISRKMLRTRPFQVKRHAPRFHWSSWASTFSRTYIFNSSTWLSIFKPWSYWKRFIPITNYVSPVHVRS